MDDRLFLSEKCGARRGIEKLTSFMVALRGEGVYFNGLIFCTF